MPSQFAGVIHRHHFVSAIGQASEAEIAFIRARSNGGGGAQQARTGAVPQLHRDTAKTPGFRAIQHTVGIGVLPQRTAEGVGGGGFAVAEVLVEVYTTGRGCQIHRADAIRAAVWVHNNVQPRGQCGVIHTHLIGGGRV